jgi:membrane-associated protease RseP (regulator of RpoE activity)
MWKSILVIVCSLLCLVIVAAGTSEAKGGHGARSSGSRGQAHHAKPHPITAFQPKQAQHDHKHKHKHKPMGDVDGELDAPSSDADEAEEAEAQNGEEDQEAEEAETALYGVEITGLFKGTAAKEGLEIGDIILNFNGTPTPTFEALADAVARSGSQAQVLVIRGDGGERETVTLFPKDGRIGLSGDPVRVNK